MLYRRSPYLQVVTEPVSNWSIVYHSLFGNPLLINDIGLQLLCLFSQPMELSDVVSLCDADPTELLRIFVDANLVLPEGMDERGELARRKSAYIKRVQSGLTIDRMGLAVSDICNFACPHCIHYQRQGGNSGVITNPGLMTTETARQCVDHFVSVLRRNSKYVAGIHFGNAEPFINWEVIHQILLYCRDQFPEITFQFDINTNLFLLNEQIATTLRDFGVRINTSLDGLEEANDRIRRTVGDQPTFAKVVRNMDLLAELGYPLDGFSVTVTDRNFDLIDERIVDFASERDMTDMAFDYDLISVSHIPVEERVGKLLRLKQYANKKGIDFFGTWDSVWRNLNNQDANGTFGFCAAVAGHALEFAVDGQIRVCSHSTTSVGHLDRFSHLLDIGQGLPQLVHNRFPGSESSCMGCEIEGLCAGQCQVTREVAARCRPAQEVNLLHDYCRFYCLVTRELLREQITTEVSD